MKRSSSYITFTFFLDGAAEKLWPKVLSAIEDAVGKPVEPLKGLSGKRVQVYMNGEPVLVGRSRAIAHCGNFAIVLSEEIGGPNFHLSRLQVGKEGGRVYLDLGR
jgi:hypothetical protein